MQTNTLEKRLSDELRAELERYPNVTGTAVGPKQTNGEGMTDELSVIVFVSEKVEEDDLDDDDVIPSEVEVDGQTYKTDVQYFGEAELLAAMSETAHLEGAATEAAEPASVPDSLSRREKWRPASAGVSVGHPQTTAGTLGSPPLKTSSGKLVFLTNSHIAAASGQATAGDAIMQPGRVDGGQLPRDEIGTLVDFSSFETATVNTTDSALVEITPDHLDEDIFELQGDLRGWEETVAGRRYVKSGRTTGVTRGRCTARSANISIGASQFVGIDVFEPMAAGGDSGSLIVRETGDGLYGASLLFAGASDPTSGVVTHTFGVPMEAVQAAHGRLTPVASQNVVRPADLRIVGTQYRGRIDPGRSQRLFTFNWPADEVVDWSVYPTTDDARLTSSVMIERKAGDKITYFVTVRNVGNVASNYELRYARFQ
jgi:hypothetical protein